MTSSLRPLLLNFNDGEITHLAVALHRGDYGEGPCSHSILLYRQKDKVYGLHLLLSGEVGKIPPEHIKHLKFGASVPGFHADLLGNVCSLCDSLLSNPPRMAYWLGFTKDTVLSDKGHTITLADGSIGLTCATFVLAVFLSQGLELLRLEEWTERDAERAAEDDEWQRRMLKKIADDPLAYGLSDELVNQGKQNIPCLRYRPEDLVGGCRVGDHPSPYKLSDEAGRDAVKQVDAMCGYN